jgi:hypothetical protein
MANRILVFVGKLDRSLKNKLENLTGRLNMKKAKLIKKDSPLQEQIRQSRKARRSRGKKAARARNAIEVTTDWLRQRKEDTPGAREAFAALFAKTDPQSA